MLLAVAVATSDALLNTLGVPGEVVIDNHGAELEVNPLCACFGGDHDLCFISEPVNECGAHVGCSGAGDAVAVFIFFRPTFIQGFGQWITVCSIEENNFVVVTIRGKEVDQVVLGFP